MQHEHDPASVETLNDRSTERESAVEGVTTLRGVDAAAIRSADLFAAGGRYRPGDLLGVGGVGEVRLCLDERIGREVAIKTLREHPEEGSEQWQRFVREARVQGQLEHPAVVPVYDLGQNADGALFFSMRRVQGASLAEVLASLAAGDPEATARWSRRKLLSAFVQVCLAVDYAHSRGVVHRDLKPSNVMLGDFGEVQVLDWGVARVGHEVDGPRPNGPAVTTDGDRITIDGTLIGTPPYMPPEQLMGDLARITARTDVYALGLMLYEVLTRRAYHAGRTMMEVSGAAASGIDPRPSRVFADVAPELDEACGAATRVEPADRLPSARALADAVEAYLDGESDRARRSALAVEHGARAMTALDAPGASADAAVRRSAMRDALQSMALDPGQGDGRRAFVRLMTDEPATLPPEVVRDLDDTANAARREGISVGTRAWIIWLCTSPILPFLGLRSAWTFIVPTTLCVFGAALSFWLSRHRSVNRWQVTLYALTFSAFVACFSMWLGPFILMPTAVAMLLLFGIFYSRPGERVPFTALSAATVALPVALEAAGLLPPSYRYVPEGLLLLPRALEVRPGRTTFALIWTAVSFIVAPAFYLGRLRDALSVAERRLALHAWQLRQIGDDPADPPRR